MLFLGSRGLVIPMAWSSSLMPDGMNTRGFLPNNLRDGDGRLRFMPKMSLDCSIAGGQAKQNAGASARCDRGDPMATFNGSCSAANGSLIKPARGRGGAGLSSTLRAAGE